MMRFESAQMYNEYINTTNKSIEIKVNKTGEQRTKPNKAKMSRPARGRNFTFTLNNYAEDDIEKLRAIDWIKYCRVGKEVGESGTPHLQGYIQVDNKKQATASAMAKKLKKAGLSKQPHIEIARGSLEDNQRYTSKDGDWTEWGESKKERQGKRTDIDKFLEDAKEMDELTLATEHPSAYCKYWKAAERVRTMTEESREKAKLHEEMSAKELMPWQKEAIEKLESQDDRTVLWYVDYEGGRGKTWLAKWLISERNAFYMQGGKTADIAHAYKGEEYVVCDFTRDKEETVQYSAIESLKNGIIFSPKYDSRTKVRSKGAKVIVFSNWDPDESKLSEDRWQIINISEHPLWKATRKTARAAKRSRSAMEEDDEDWGDEDPEASHKRARR